jgi:phosphodiesterase/alkaline phosphatase D-like protein
MKKLNPIFQILFIVFLFVLNSCKAPEKELIALDPNPFPGERGENLDTHARSDMWENPGEGFFADFVRVPRNEVVAFALYTHQNGKLKMSAQLYPLKADEAMEVRLELKTNGQWRRVKTASVVYPGWSAHFEIENWDDTKDVPYRVLHGKEASFEGLIRKDPVDKQEIVVASLSCNSNRDRGDRNSIVENLLKQDPDLLFFAGDQSYDHLEHTAAWLLWGKQFKEVIKDRPVITIIDDHDIAQGNIWGEGGKVADSPAGDNGGYFYPAEYIKMVERCQTWHLPDPVDPEPIKQGIGVYFTRLTVGGVDFAILEDRKFKSGPRGKIPEMGPRSDHINDESYDPATIDLPGLELLGERQIRFLHDWGQDWTDTDMKAVLSQSAFCGAVHIHGNPENRLLADLDCNGWPQTGRNNALREIRRAMAPHLCGDQHLSVIVKHGIDEFRDGPFAFTNPAIVNTYYARWWWPKDEKAGGGEAISNDLPWTGDYLDGLHNKFTMYAYANPPDFEVIRKAREAKEENTLNLGDGYGIVRFDKNTRQITFECWPRFSDVSEGDEAQFPGWPLTFAMEENDGRKVYGYLPELHFDGIEDPVVQVVHEESNEILYTMRIKGNTFSPRVFAKGTYTVKAGTNRPDSFTKTGLQPNDNQGQVINIKI